MPSTLSLLPKIKGKKVLDVGRGPGIYARILTKKGAKVWGVDTSDTLLALARKEAPSASFQKALAKQKEWRISCTFQKDASLQKCKKELMHTRMKY